MAFDNAPSAVHVDQLLTNLTLNWATEQNFIADKIFPVVDVQKKSDELKAQTMKHMIRGQKEEQKELRAQENALKRQQQRLDLIRRINEENEKRVQIQVQVARLEKEEADWIRKLQNTSQVQAQAFSELEVALNGEVAALQQMGQ